MNIQDFKVGKDFSCGDKMWRCTDKGSRVIIAICLDDSDVLDDPRNLSARHTLFKNMFLMNMICAGVNA